MNDKIVLLIGRSGSGKSTIATYCEQNYSLKQTQSYTTRLPRSPTETGHIFVTRDEFHEIKDIAGYTEYQGNFYCATTEQVDNSDIYVIDKDGLEFFKKNYHGNKTPIVIQIVASFDSHENFNMLYERIKTRALKNGKTIEEAADEASHRVSNDNIDFRGIGKLIDYTLQNKEEIDVEIIASQINKLIKGDEKIDNKHSE